MLTPKGVTIVVSLALHAGLGLAAGARGGGHARAATTADDAIAVEAIEVIDPPAPHPEEVTEPKDDDHDHAPLAVTHTHPYPVAPDHDAHPHDPSQPHAPLAPAVAAAAGGSPASTSAPTSDAPSAPPRFVMPDLGKGVSSGSGSNPGASSGSASGAGAGAGAGANTGADANAIVPESSVSVGARPVMTVKPAYPAAARQAEVEGDVVVEIVVDTAGRVTEARSVKRAGYGFDEAAVAAIRQYRFSVAQRAGQPVRVRMRWTVRFRLGQ